MDLDLAAMPEYVRERWPAALERAARKTEAAKQNPVVKQLVKAAQRGSTASQRVVWLQRAASAWAQPLSEFAACRKGCAHCCHIPVTVSAVEAALIGRHVGRKPVSPARAVRMDSFDVLEDALAAVQEINAGMEPSPCPMLADGVCSVYEVRPMACRLLVNMDDDDLLCRLVPGQAIPVPYADSRLLKALYVMSQLASPMADIRDFFPQQGHGIASSELGRVAADGA